MGVFTVYDALTGNPGVISNDGLPEELFKKKYGWHNNGARVVLKDGSITEEGYYDSYGRVIVNERAYGVINTWDQFDYTDDEHDGFMLLESVYQLLISHPKYSELPDDFNLYSNLKTFINHIWLKPLDKITDSQTVVVISKDLIENYRGTEVVCDTVNSWPFTDPESTRFGRKNKKRMLEIIEYFLDR